MQRRLILLVIGVAVCLGVFGISGLAVVKSTVAAYDGGAPCARLEGIPGVLQDVGLLPSGTCATTNDGRTCAQPGAPCRFSNGNPSPSGEDKKTGKCRQLNNNCQCKPD